MSAPVRNRATARSAALRVLTACRKNGAWADASLKAQLSRDRLSESDAALCTRMVYGVLQNRLLLEYYLSAYCFCKLDGKSCFAYSCRPCKDKKGLFLCIHMLSFIQCA